MGERNGTHGLAGEPLSAVELDVLEACHEATVRQQELLRLLAPTMGVPEPAVFYAWADRRVRQQWVLGETGWRAYFHGLECDLAHADGRRVRLDFGPGGRVDTCTAWGVFLFATTAAAPWPEYPDLRRLSAPPEMKANHFGGDTDAFYALWDHLAARGAFQVADAGLVAFRDRFTTTGPDGLRLVRYPEDTPERTQYDCSVAHRTTLSPVGFGLLQFGRAARSPAA